MIRNAKSDDIEKIFEIYEKVKLDRARLGDINYETSIQKKGFLLGLDKKEDLLKEIDDSYKFLVKEEDSQILGYLIADHSEEQKFYDDEYKTWFFPGMKDYYYESPKGMTIASIAVDPKHSGHGVANALLEKLEEKLKKEKYEYLFSIVTTAPLTNCPTIVWHTKNGFKSFAMGSPRRLFGLDNYVAVLLYKDL